MNNVHSAGLDGGAGHGGHSREGLYPEAGQGFPEGITFVLAWRTWIRVSGQDVGLSVRMLSELQVTEEKIIVSNRQFWLQGWWLQRLHGVTWVSGDFSLSTAIH